MKTTLLAIGLFSLTLSLHAGWVVSPDATQIAYSAKQAEGYASFDEALKNVSHRDRIQKLDGISAYALLSDEAFQAELFAGLEREAPREFKEAQKSAGNMHNPKIIKLRKFFERALLAGPTITKLNASLAAYGLTISHAEFEKFELRTSLEDSRRRFYGGLWLHVTKLPSQGGAATL